MTKSRITAKEAKSLATKAKQEIFLKNSLVGLHQKKLKLMLKEIIGAAFKGENAFEYIDEDQIFLKFCCDELHKLGFSIGLNDSVSSEAIKNIEQEIILIEEKIDTVGIRTAKKINAIGNKLYLFLNSDAKYVAAYEWLIDAYDGFPLISDEWYTLDDIESLEIIDDAERDGLLRDNINNFDWQDELKNIISNVKYVHDRAKQEIKILREKVLNIEAKKNLKDEGFRIYRPKDSELGHIFSVKFFWNTELSSSRRELRRAPLFSPDMLSWISSEIGQYFFDCIDENIKISSEKGENAIIQDIYKEEDGSFVVIEIDEVTVPPPDLVAEIYCLMGYRTEIMSADTTDQEWPDSSLIQLKISW